VDGAGLLSDALDVGAGLASARTTGVRGVISAVIASPVVAADLWSLATLIETRRAAEPSAVRKGSVM
jgi:hypothetical protein